AEIDDRDRRRVRELARELGLAQEPPRDDLVDAGAVAHHLERDVATHRLLPRAIHHAHPALADLLADHEPTVEGAAEQRIAPEPDQPRAVVRAGRAGDAVGPIALRTVRVVAGPDVHRITRAGRRSCASSIAGVISIVVVR